MSDPAPLLLPFALDAARRFAPCPHLGHTVKILRRGLPAL
jgi:hypothetical protein